MLVGKDAGLGVCTGGERWWDRLGGGSPGVRVQKEAGEKTRELGGQGRVNVSESQEENNVCMCV